MNYERLVALCKENGTNFRQLEIKLGFGNGTIAKWYGTYPRADRLKAVADYFGVTMEELM